MFAKTGYSLLACCFFASSQAATTTAGPSAAIVPEQAFSALQWRSIGPFRGGRAVAVAGVPGSPNTFYFGAAAGGVWKSVDAGATWKPIFDAAKGSASIGAIAVAPSNPSVLYVGTGEGNLRGDVTWGNGVFKSTDAGATWTSIGLNEYTPDRCADRRSARSQRSAGGRHRTRLRSEHRARRVPHRRRWPDLEPGAVQG